MKTISISLLFIFFAFSAFAQSTTCNCNNVFEDLIEKVESNYIALAQIRSAGFTNKYDKRKIEFRKQSHKILPNNCTEFLQDFLSYFKDGHIFVYEQPEYSQDDIKNFKAKIKSNTVELNSIIKTLDFEKEVVEKNKLDGIIGKWTDGESEMAIIKDEGYYKAYILKTKLETIESGELKAQFKISEKGFDGIYYSYGYSPRYIEGNIFKEKSLLVLTGGMYWAKIGALSNRELSMINYDEVNLPTIQKLDDKNTLFSISSFLADYTKFIKVITGNIEVLKNTTNLIIDVRGNIGGNAIYFSFIDAYATKTLKGGQGLVLASIETQKYFERLAKNSPELYQPVVEKIKQNLGKIIEGPKYSDRQFPPFESKIENVAILTDEGSMSAAESFILHSKGASDKVKTFGSPTGGVIDYTSINTLLLKSGNQNIYFGYPTSTYHKDIPKNGYNETGIIPDVLIKTSVKDKVGFIINYY